MICVFCVFVLFIFDYFSSQCFPLVTTYPDSPHQCLCAFKPWPALPSPPDCLSFFLNKLALIYLLPRGFQWMLDLLLPRPCRTTYWLVIGGLWHLSQLLLCFGLDRTEKSGSPDQTRQLSWLYYCNIWDDFWKDVQNWSLTIPQFSLTAIIN